MQRGFLNILGLNMNSNKIYPRKNDKQTIYLKSTITNINIKVGDYTIYNNFVNYPREFEKIMYCTIIL